MQSLGPWFASATVRKVSAPVTPVTICLFYQYARPSLKPTEVDALKSFIESNTKTNSIGGRIRIAAEGLNCTISGSSTGVRDFTTRLAAFKRDGEDATPFASTHFKFIDELGQDRAFKDLKVLPVKELVFYGDDEYDATKTASGSGGVHLQPKDFHEKLASKDAVVIDVRNHYEAQIGRFDKQGLESCGAEYIDPKMRKSTDFPAWLKKPETKAKLAGKEILMYCTGGVRCEIASVLLKRELGEEATSKGVYQLQGGIENYFKEHPDGGYWNGSNFVFDKREGVSIESGPEGVGGVVRKEKGDKKKSKKEKEKSTTNGSCCVCKKGWDRYIGKKKCYTCGVPVLMCDGCMSLKPDKTPGKELSVRCPLCVDEGITVPAADTEWVDNGKKSTSSAGFSSATSSDGKRAAADMQEQPKSSSTTLKWGGGSSKKKQEKKAMEEITRMNVFKRKACTFGDSCTRTDCWFGHPRDEEAGTAKNKNKKTKFQ